MTEIECWLAGYRAAKANEGYRMPANCWFPGAFWHGYASGKD